MVRFYLHIFASAALSFLSAMKKVFISCAPSINYFCNCETNVFFFFISAYSFPVLSKDSDIFPETPTEEQRLLSPRSRYITRLTQYTLWKSTRKAASFIWRWERFLPEEKARRGSGSGGGRGEEEG